ncbi:MAG TPA: serine/threonine-protein kinase [Kofleriaceae bacterium]
MLDRIAVGGMAEVFLAKAYGAHGFEKTLAIKRILPELASDPEFAARFIAEAKVAVRLSHANVVQVFDFGRIGESLFIAMEYVDGLDLAALLKKYKDDGRHIPLPAALHIAIEIIRGLDFAHQHSVVHRDVSPSNILISRAGEVKLGDFGIAVAASPHRANRGTGPRRVMGKWRYMSPEQARGDTLDTRSDLFSAASVMFELFTGQKLFPGDEAEDIIKNIETMPIPKTSSIRAGLPSRLDEILAGPLARRPIDRPTRPATVLRQLIELSYESSIMATALDVSEAVASVLPAKRISGPGQHLDDVIRKQLGAAERERSVARRTAVTDGKPPSTETMDRLDHSTGMIRKIGLDGLSQLEEIEIDPTAVAAPRAKRMSESGSVKAITGPSSPDSAMHELLDAHFDPDRRTEVGGPPTGQVPKADATPNPKKIVTKTEQGLAKPSRAGLWIAIVVVVAAAGGFGAWKLLQQPEQSEVVTPAAVKDGGFKGPLGTLEIDPNPEGATGHIADADGVVAEKFGPTTHKNPTRLGVEADAKFRVHIEKEGYEPFDQERTIKANETLVIAPELRKAKAILRVTTTPDGAQVTLKGKLLGETPLVRNDLEATNGELVITKAGFEPYKQKVELVAGKTIEVLQTLKASAKVGTISLLFKGGGWGDVYYKGTLLGRAPSRNLRAPVGKQTFQLVNTGHTPSIKWTVTCDVSETETKVCTTQLP